MFRLLVNAMFSIVAVVIDFDAATPETTQLWIIVLALCCCY